MSIDLLRYPSTYGGSTAELECADNAYSNSSDMTVECDVSGAWSEHTPPQCLCDDAYREALTGDEFIIICEGNLCGINEWLIIILQWFFLLLQQFPVVMLRVRVWYAIRLH